MSSLVLFLDYFAPFTFVFNPFISLNIIVRSCFILFFNNLFIILLYFASCSFPPLECFELKFSCTSFLCGIFSITNLLIGWKLLYSLSWNILTLLCWQKSCSRSFQINDSNIRKFVSFLYRWVLQYEIKENIDFSIPSLFFHVIVSFSVFLFSFFLFGFPFLVYLSSYPFVFFFVLLFPFFLHFFVEFFYWTFLYNFTQRYSFYSVFHFIFPDIIHLWIDSCKISQRFLSFIFF